MDTSLNFATIDWTNRKSVSEAGKRATSLIKMMQKQFDLHVPHKRLKPENANRINIAIF
jgi:IS4 transposase